MKKKLKNIINSKGGIITIISVSAFFVFGLACFIVGYGLTDGWDKVLAWFTSRYAIMVYTFFGLWVLLVLWAFFLARRSE